MTTEKHVRYSTDVDTLPEAWVFIMTHADEFPTPSVDIRAYTTDETARYAVSIHGLT